MSRPGSAFERVLAVMKTADKQREQAVLRTLKRIGVKPGKQASWEAKAHHEAGHIVLGVSLGRKLKAGVRVGDDSDVEFWAREDRSDERRKERIRIAIAGPIAEANYAGSSAGGGSDIPLAYDLIGELGVTRAERSSVLADLAAEVRATLEKAPVEKLAEAILRTGSLSKNELLAELERLHRPQ